MTRFFGLLLALTFAATSCSSTEERSSEPALEILTEIYTTRPANIAVTPHGRVILTNHPLDQPELRAIEVLSDGSTRPFPTLDWSDGPEIGAVGLAGGIGITADTKGNVWFLDMGSEESAPQIVAWNTITEELHRRIEIPSDVTLPISFLQDFALDEKREKIYIADMSFPAPGDLAQPAFVVVDLKSGECWRVLEGAEPLMPSERDVVIDGSLVGPEAEEPTAWRLGLNPIAIDPSFEWVYFGTINGDSIYRLPAETLAERSLSREERSAQIERYAPKPPCDGIAVDSKGRVYITDIEASAVGVATPGGYELLAQDSVLLSWPDGFALGPDASLYVSQNHLHAHPALNEGVDESRKPYHVLKIALP